ncbi:MAG: OmpA family protein [Sandaracinaceae bacterium]
MGSSFWMGALGLVSLLIAVGCGGPEYPNCDNDEQCHESEFCVNGACQQCRGDSDCPAGQSCASGRCEAIPGWCGSDADCGPNEECVNNRCVARQVVQEPIEQAPPACQLSSVYFAYDSSELDGNSRSTLEGNAACMNERDMQSVTITGHCDPRGTEEYNLALGERRAQTVQGHLGRLGVDRGRTTTRSMGEEMARGSSESSWGQDRRAAFEER